MESLVRGGGGGARRGLVATRQSIRRGKWQGRRDALNTASRSPCLCLFGFDGKDWGFFLFGMTWEYLCESNVESVCHANL